MGVDVFQQKHLEVPGGFRSGNGSNGHEHNGNGNSHNRYIDATVPLFSVDALPRELEASIRQDFDAVGLDQRALKGVALRDFNGTMLPDHYYVETSHGGTLNASALVTVEVGYQDGAHHIWDGRVILFPTTAEVNGEQLPILPIMNDIGYHVLVKKPEAGATSLPMIRNDSLCVPSMIDGHFASASDRTLGCDCEPQRHHAQRIIQMNAGGGISFLAPHSGRGNGTFTHTGQLQMQNYAKRHGLMIPDTYRSHELQGVPGDQRDLLYPIDAAMIHMFRLFPDKKAILLTNNPKKNIFGIINLDVIEQAFHVPDRETYYAGEQFQTKVRDGGHTQYNGNK